jgi:RHS repeat-associated protein
VADHLGTPRINVRGTGADGGTLASVSRHDYLAFGEEIGSSVGGRGNPQQGYGTPADGVRQQFTEYERDTETGLDFAQARYYASAQGRFTSVDPLLASAILADPQSWNRYSYVGNRPLLYTDPTGLQWGRNTSGEYKWFPSGVVDDGWEKVSLFTEYQSVNGRVVLQNGGYWDYVKPPVELPRVDGGAQVVKLWLVSVGIGLTAPATIPGAAIALGTELLSEAVAEYDANHPFLGDASGIDGTQHGTGYVDLTDSRGRTHILDGDATGGGHRPGTGISGKSEFPAGWSDDEIIHHISDVATDPASTATPGRNGRTVVNGTRKGVDIRVILESARRGGRIVTGFPTNRPRNR